MAEKKTADDLAFEKAKIDHQTGQTLEVERQKAEWAARIEFMKAQSALSLAYIQSFREYGATTLRSIFLINGGAIVSLLAFMASSARSEKATALSPSAFVCPFLFFVAGLLLTILASFAGFLNFRAFYGSTAHEGNLAENVVGHDGRWPEGKVSQAFLGWTNGIAIACGFAALFAFVAGCILTSVAFARA
jgi:hypothetical protein